MIFVTNIIKKLFDCETTDSSTTNTLFSELEKYLSYSGIKLQNYQKNKLNRSITSEEIKSVIRSTYKESSTGKYGLTYRFYKLFISKIANFLLLLFITWMLTIFYL